MSKNDEEKNYQVTPRDEKALHFIADCGTVRQSTLHAVCYSDLKHERHVHGKLLRLVKLGLIGQHFPLIVPSRNTDLPASLKKHRREIVYYMEKTGAALISRPYNARHARMKEHQGFHHRLDAVDVRGCMELACGQSEDTGLAQWWDEYDRDEDGEFIIHDKVVVPGLEKPLPLRPDGAVVLQDLQTGTQDLFFLEIDEGSESARKRWKDKVLTYQHYWQGGFRERYDFKGFRVLVVCRSQTGKNQDARRQTLIKTTYETVGRRTGMFWFCTFADAMPEDRASGDHILTSPIWQRPDARDAKQCGQIALCNHLFGRDL